MIRKNRKSALEHYQVNAGGEYVYTGKYLRYQQQEKSRKQALTGLWALCIPMAAAAVACGCIPAPGMVNTFYVLLPLMVEIVLVISCLWSLGQITAGGDPMKEYVYRDSVEKLPGRLVAVMVFAGITTAAELLYLILEGGFGLSVGVVLGLQVLVFALAMWAKKNISQMKWTENV